MSKHGLGLADIVANVNFFSKVAVDDDGKMAFVPNHASAGNSVDLRTEMNVLLVLANCPHPMNPATEYPVCRVHVEILPSEAPGLMIFAETSARSADAPSR